MDFSLQNCTLSMEPLNLNQNYNDEEESEQQTKQQQMGLADEHHSMSDEQDQSSQQSNLHQDDHAGAENPPDIWVLPANKDECNLEEIRRGQVINKTASNECPVYKCGKKINENVIHPSPGTIASGLRTHVLFVHYMDRKCAKKRKLGWSVRRKSHVSPKKPVSHASALAGTTSIAFKGPNEASPQRDQKNFSLPNLTSKRNTDPGFNANKNPSPTQSPSLKTSLPLIKNSSTNPAPRPLLQGTGSLLNKIQQIKASKAQSQQMMSSQQSRVQAPSSSKAITQKPKNQDAQPLQNSSLDVQSSLFSILAGLTQQQQVNQPTNTNNIKGVIELTPASRGNLSNQTAPGNRTVNSSLLSLLNEKISGSSVATSLQSHLKKTLKGGDLSSQRSRQSVSSPANAPLFQNNGDLSYNNSSPLPNHPGTSLLNNDGSSLLNNESSFLNNSSSLPNGQCPGNGDRISQDNQVSLESFIELIAFKTNSNIGPAAIAEARKITEKFISSLLCSSQTIADHYVTPYVGEVPQQKPEISASDIVLAYKMMHKSQP